tara:strand:- start:72 stop:314 length:243 start_codon:yes stop_codon:yes gene_type:complete
MNLPEEKVEPKAIFSHDMSDYYKSDVFKNVEVFVYESKNFTYEFSFFLGGKNLLNRIIDIEENTELNGDLITQTLESFDW